MSGFKNFLLRGNLIEIATGLIVALAFNEVVQTFTNWLTALMPQGMDDYFSNEETSFGAFANAVISFVIMAAVVYFLIIVPYTKAKERFFPTDEKGTPEDVVLLTEIRDLLAGRGTTN